MKRQQEYAIWQMDFACGTYCMQNLKSWVALIATFVAMEFAIADEMAGEVTRYGASEHVLRQMNLKSEMSPIIVSGGENRLQDAIDSAPDGATIIVQDGIYNPIKTYNKRITIQSANGASVTSIDARGLSRCANLRKTPMGAFEYEEPQLSETNTVLIGFTLLNGDATREYEDAMTGPLGVGCGGGVAGGTIKNCIIKNCHACYGGGSYRSHVICSTIMDCTVYDDDLRTNVFGLCQGGGAFRGWIDNCLIARNYADCSEGAVNVDSIVNSTVVSNSVRCGIGGFTAGIYSPTIINTIAWDNYLVLTTNAIDVAEAEAEGSWTIPVFWTNRINNIGVGMNAFLPENTNMEICNLCTYPDLEYYWLENEGKNCFTNNPCFVDFDSGDYRLTAMSPCVDAGLTGSKLAPVGEADLDGKPRIVDSKIDIGAYEFQEISKSERPDDLRDETVLDEFAGWLNHYRLLAYATSRNKAVAMAGLIGESKQRTLLQEFIAGTNPTNENSVFKATIEMNGDTPVVKWEPDLNTDAVQRVYTIHGKSKLDEQWTTPTNSLHRFFKVTVELP